MKNLQFPHQTQVLKSAVISRLLLLSLIVIWRSLLRPYDTSTSLNPDCLADPRHRQHSASSSIGSKIENGIVWDSVYFIRIAQCGYEYEQTYAFLPLLPACIRLVSRTVLAPFVGVFGYRAVLGLAGYVVSNFAFLFAAVYFYRLSIMILKDSDAALHASILFCFNPASIFYSSIYSESLYALFSVGGLYYLMSGAFNVSVIWLAISGCARSNGVVNAGYVCFQTMHWAYDALFVKKRGFGSRFLEPELVYSLGFRASSEGKDFASVLFSSGTAPESKSTYISQKPSLKIQGKQNLRHRKQINRENPAVLSVDDQSSMKSGYLSPSVLPFIFHLGFMAATAFFVMHVQVSTRFLSASPPLYWFASYLMASPGSGKKWGYLIWAYCAAYILLGSLLFSNFYPFT